MFPLIIQEKCVVRNSTQNGQQWQKEERHGPAFPFTVGQVFTLEFEAHLNRVHVNVNGEEFCQFEYRNSFPDVSSLDIDGDLDQLHSVSIIG
jgi:hypothetical protein